MSKEKISRIRPGELHHQIVHFVGGIKRTIPNVKYIWENEMTHVIDSDGIEWVINKNNVLMVEKVRAEDDRPGIGESHNSKTQSKDGKKTT